MDQLTESGWKHDPILQQVELFLPGSRFLLRSQLKGDVSQAIRAAEVALPPVLQEIA